MHRRHRQPHRCHTVWARTGGASIVVVAVAVAAITSAGVMISGPREPAVLARAAEPTAPAMVAKGPSDARSSDTAAELERQRLAATDQPSMEKFLRAADAASAPTRLTP